jgi:hypothetical protein
MDVSMFHSREKQEILKRLDTSWIRFFEKVAKRPPKKKKREYFSSFVFPQSTKGFKLQDNKITITKLRKTYKFSKSRDYANVKQEGGSMSRCNRRTIQRIKLLLMKKILFKDPLILASVKGFKTMTRRVLKHQPQGDILLDQYGKWREVTFHNSEGLPSETRILKSQPRYKFGETVYIAETFARSFIPENDKCPDNPLAACGDPNCWETIYKMDGIYTEEDGSPVEWMNRLFMPAEYARYFLRIVSVGLEKLQSISDFECEKEGIVAVWDGEPAFVVGWSNRCDGITYNTRKEAFAALINYIKPGIWEKNPWVYCYEYRYLDDYKYVKD